MPEISFLAVRLAIAEAKVIVSSPAVYRPLDAGAPRKKREKTFTWTGVLGSFLRNLDSLEQMAQFSQGITEALKQSVFDFGKFLAEFAEAPSQAWQGNLRPLLKMLESLLSAVGRLIKLFYTGELGETLEEGLDKYLHGIENAATPYDLGESIGKIVAVALGFAAPAVIAKVFSGIKSLAIAARTRNSARLAAANIAKGTGATANAFNHSFIDFLRSKKHLVYVEDVTQSKGVSGGHNAVEFSKVIKEYNLIIVDDPPFVNGIKTIQYHVQALDKQLKPTGRPKGGVQEKKTVYAPKIYSDEYMAQLGAIAAEKALPEALKRGIREINTHAGGINFRFYVDLGLKRIENFHPTK